MPPTPHAAPLREILLKLCRREDLTRSEARAAFDHVAFFYKFGLGYANEMGNRPQTLYAIQDSPVGLAAWIIDHDIWTYKMIARVFDGVTEGLTRDDVLDNITITWLTNTAISGARLYWEALPRTSSIGESSSIGADWIVATRASSTGGPRKAASTLGRRLATAEQEPTATAALATMPSSTVKRTAAMAMEMTR